MANTTEMRYPTRPKGGVPFVACHPGETRPGASPPRGRLSPQPIAHWARSPPVPPRPEENFSRSLSRQGKRGHPSQNTIVRNGQGSAKLQGHHALLGRGTSWGNLAPPSTVATRSKSENSEAKFNAVVHTETKNEFGTRIAKYVADYVRDGRSANAHEFRSWRKWPSHLDWDSKNSNLRDQRNIRIKRETSQWQWDMKGKYDDRLPPGRGVPATQTVDLASYRSGQFLPPKGEDAVPICHSGGPSKAGRDSPTRSPMKMGEMLPCEYTLEHKENFRTIFVPMDKSETFGKVSPGADKGHKFSSLTVSEALPDYNEGMRQKRMIQNKFPDYEFSIELDKINRIPPPARLNLTHAPVRPYQKLNRFDGTRCARDEN